MIGVNKIREKFPSSRIKCRFIFLNQMSPGDDIRGRTAFGRLRFRSSVMWHHANGLQSESIIGDNCHFFCPCGTSIKCIHAYILKRLEWSKVYVVLHFLRLWCHRHHTNKEILYKAIVTTLFFVISLFSYEKIMIYTFCFAENCTRTIKKMHKKWTHTRKGSTCV